MSSSTRPNTGAASTRASPSAAPRPGSSSRPRCSFRSPRCRSEQLLSWGWRVPFLAERPRRASPDTSSAARWTRPPSSRQVAADGDVARMPLVVLLRNHWADVLRVVAAALIASVSTIFTVYALELRGEHGRPRQDAACSGSACSPTSPHSRDPAVGQALRPDRPQARLPVGSLGSAVMIFVYLGAISAGSYLADLRDRHRIFGVVYTRGERGVARRSTARCSRRGSGCRGTAIGTQIGFAISGFLPTFAARVAGPGRAPGSASPSSPPPCAWST